MLKDHAGFDEAAERIRLAIAQNHRGRGSAAGWSRHRRSQDAVTKTPVRSGERVQKLAVAVIADVEQFKLIDDAPSVSRIIEKAVGKPIEIERGTARFQKISSAQGRSVRKTSVVRIIVGCSRSSNSNCSATRSMLGHCSSREIP